MACYNLPTLRLHRKRALVAKVNFTADRVTAFRCEEGKQQSIFWDAKTPGLGLRVTAGGAKSYIFETRLHGKTIRITIGATRTWSVVKAQGMATRYKAQTDEGIDPRQVKAEQLAAQNVAKEIADAKALRESGRWATYGQNTSENVRLIGQSTIFPHIEKSSRRAGRHASVVQN